jgi:hypothetical protein
VKKSKAFRVAREGATTDGRKISREWITQMAANYDPKLFGARVNLEHLKGILPDGPFRAYGDVLSLSTEEEKGILYLVAEISPTDDLIAMNKKRQKVYTSIEVNPSFADTGEAYLVGLAVTDDPASLGTEMLEFSATAKHNPLSARKADPDNLFTAAEEVTLEFSEVEDDKPSLVSTVKALFRPLIDLIELGGALTVMALGTVFLARGDLTVERRGARRRQGRGPHRACPAAAAPGERPRCR